MTPTHDPHAWDPFAPQDAEKRADRQRRAEYDLRFQAAAAARPQAATAPVPTPLSPVAEATGLLGHGLQLTEQLVLTLQDRLAPVLRPVPVSPLGWNDAGLEADCPLTQDLTDHTAYLIAINTSLHRLVEQLAL